MKKYIQLKNIGSMQINPSYLKWMNDYEIVKFTEQKWSKHTLKKIRKFVKEKNKSKFEYLYGIFLRNKHVGNIKLGVIDFNHKSAEISFFVGEKKLWNPGITTQALKLLIIKASKEFKLIKLNAWVLENNLAAKKVLLKNSFKKEGSQKNQCSFEGKRVAHDTYGLSFH